MILHEAPSMETTTPKGEWFPCWVAEWSIMENMQQQMWFGFYPSPISINISIYVYNALWLTPEIWFWAMPFASFQIDINKYFAIVSPRCQVISNCDVMSPWITWQNNRLMKCLSGECHKTSVMGIQPTRHYPRQCCSIYVVIQLQ